MAPTGTYPDLLLRAAGRLFASLCGGKTFDHKTFHKEDAQMQRRYDSGLKSGNDYLDRLLLKVQSQFRNEPLPGELIVRFSLGRGLSGQDLTYEQLYSNPALQEAIASVVQYPPSKWLLEQEATEIKKRRLLHNLKPEMQSAPKHTELDDIYSWARDCDITGMCFSGGGIRSATFNLGILQGLATKGWLNQFDYLSSVSGGGYIHAWLAAWLKRRTLEERDKNQRIFASPEDLRAAWNHVTYCLTPLPGPTGSSKYQTVWPHQIQWLRRYSNYLTPHVGSFTSDTWSAVAMWIRNSALNQTLLMAMLLCLLCFPHLLAPRVRLAPNPSVPCTTGAGTSGLAAAVVPKALQPCLVNKMTAGPIISPDREFGSLFLKYWHGRWSLAGMKSFLYKIAGAGQTTVAALFCFATGIALIIFLLRWEFDLAVKPLLDTDDKFELMARLRRHQVLIANLILCLLLTFAILWTLITLQHPQGPAYPVVLFLLFLSMVCAEAFAGGNLVQMMTGRTQTLQWRERDTKRGERLASVITRVRLIALATPAAATGAVVGVAIAALLQSGMIDFAANWLGLSAPWSLRLVLGSVLFFWLAPFTMVVASGFVGKDSPEWIGGLLASVQGYSMIMGVSWLVLAGSTLVMPAVLRNSSMWSWIKWPAILGWIATTAASVLLGKSTWRTGGDETTLAGKILGVTLLVGPYVYLLGLMLVLSLVLEELHAPLADEFFYGNDLLFWISALLAWLFLGSLLGSRLDINEFSMHSFYRDRLTRCYLGASNLARSPSGVTGFDQRDTNDLQIAGLTINQCYPGPIPIFNCTMNVTLAWDLAWQQRKTASFAFTPFYSGYDVGWTEGTRNLLFNGFVPTGSLYRGGPNIATAMAASGAAVTPSWSYQTSPATSFLMTIFDVPLRLGFWVPNPRRSVLAGQKLAGFDPRWMSTPPSPKFAPYWMARELLSNVDDTSKYVFLTDGGHFDNLGLYELVRRRCYKIVICDAEEGERLTYEGIGAAIRKCRIDFGAEIYLECCPPTSNTGSKSSPVHVARGTIRYPETPDGAEGKVLYIKCSLASFLADPPPEGTDSSVEDKANLDLLDFPGNLQRNKLQLEDSPYGFTTGKEFTESNFEIYRRLGQRVVESLEYLL